MIASSTTSAGTWTDPPKTLGETSWLSSCCRSTYTTMTSTPKRTLFISGKPDRPLYERHQHSRDGGDDGPERRDHLEQSGDETEHERTGDADEPHCYPRGHAHDHHEGELSPDVVVPDPGEPLSQCGHLGVVLGREQPERCVGEPGTASAEIEGDQESEDHKAQDRHDDSEQAGGRFQRTEQKGTHLVGGQRQGGGDETWMASIIGWVIDVRSTVKPRMVMLLRSVRMSMAQSSIESEMAVMSISSIDPTKRNRNHEEQEDDPDDEHQVGDQDRQPTRHVALQPLDHRCEQEGDERCDDHRHQDAARQYQAEDPDQHQPDDDEKPGGVALGGLDALPVGVVQRAPPVRVGATMLLRRAGAAPALRHKLKLSRGELPAVHRQGPDDEHVQGDDQDGPDGVIGDEHEVGDCAERRHDDPHHARPVCPASTPNPASSTTMPAIRWIHPQLVASNSKTWFGATT